MTRQATEEERKKMWVFVRESCIDTSSLVEILANTHMGSLIGDFLSGREFQYFIILGKKEDL